MPKSKYGYAPQFELLDNNIAVVRNRVRVKIEDFVNHPDDEEKEKYKGKSSPTGRYAPSRKSILLALLLSIPISFALAYMTRKLKHDGQGSTIRAAPTDEKTPISQPKPPTVQKGTSLVPKPGVADAKADTAPAKDWSNCESELQRPATRVFAEKRVEPIWLPAYPTAVPKGYADFVVAMTGVPKAAKSYYRSSHSVKRCHYTHTDYKVDAVTCESIHPIVPANHPSPPDLKDQFSKKALMMLRNPLTAFPATHQQKAEAYHGQKGQVSKESWIEFRDQYVGTGGNTPLFDEWKQFILEWRNMEPYDLEEYIPIEYWTDEKKGIAVANRLRRIFKRVGFPVLYDRTEDISCLWYKHIYEPIAEEKRKQEAEGWIEPEYTTEQLELMATGLEAFKDEILKIPLAEKLRADGHLISILDSYARIVRAKLQ